MVETVNSEVDGCGACVGPEELLTDWSFKSSCNDTIGGRDAAGV